MQKLCSVILMLGLCEIAFTDLKKRKIPNRVLCVLILCRTMSLLISGTGQDWISSAKGAVLAGGSMLFFYILFDEGIGAGDVKLLAVTGLWMGSDVVWEFLFVTFFVAAIFGMVQRYQTKDRMKTIPLAVCVLIGFLWNLFRTI